MNLVGPRPTSVERFDNYSEDQKQKRKNILPGMTGGYPLYEKGNKKRTMLEREDLWLDIRERIIQQGKSLFLFNLWSFSQAIKVALLGKNK